MVSFKAERQLAIVMYVDRGPASLAGASRGQSTVASLFSILVPVGQLWMIGLSCARSLHLIPNNPAVVIPVTTQHYMMLQRNLLYTGVTRGKQLVILLGQKKAVAIAVKNVSGRRRWSKLREWLNPVCLRNV